jgi:hypothetical protein
MRADLAAAERHREVREAARAWQRRGAIDAPALAAIEGLHPDDRRRLGPVFRVLVFVFTVVVVNALFGLVGLAAASTGNAAMATLLTLSGLFLAAATELQIGPGRRRQGGTEAATAFLAVTHLLIGVAWAISLSADLGGEVAFDVALALCVAVCSAAAWRWGYVAFAVAAAGAGFLLAARTPAGRVLWIVGGVALAAVGAGAGDAASLAPAHRRAARAVAAVALVFLYFAVHIASWDARLVENLTGRGESARLLPGGRALCIAGTALVPLATLAWGVRRRRRWLIALGAAGLVASLVTLRAYVHVAPLWVVMIGSGVACLALAAVLRRYLESGAGGERAGLTADPLFEDPERRTPLELAVGAATFAPHAQPVATPPDLQPGGGRYGGGGASGSF